MERLAVPSAPLIICFAEAREGGKPAYSYVEPSGSVWIALAVEGEEPVLRHGPVDVLDAMRSS